MQKINLKKPSGNLGFYSRSYSHNRHNRLLAYNYMFPDKQIYLFTTNRLGDINKWIVPNLKIIPLGNGIVGQLKLISECKKIKIDYLNNLGKESINVLFALNKLITGTKYIPSRFLNHKIGIVYKLIFRYSDKILTNDYFTYDYLVEQFGGKVNYCPAPTNMDQFLIRDRNKARKKLNLPIKKKIILNVGRITKKKGSEYLYNAIVDNKDILFITIGKILDEKFGKLSEINHIHLEVAEGDKLVDYYNAADLGFFVMNISGGGLAMTSQECLACGTPIMINEEKDEGFNKDILISVMPLRKIISKNINRFFEGNYKTKMLRDSCRYFAIERCSWRKWKKNYRKVFRM